LPPPSTKVRIRIDICSSIILHDMVLN
jgi:hypothetical protein